MSSIDSRVVEAKFDNTEFEHGVRTTLNSLDNLKKGLKLDGATKGLQNIDQAAKGMHFNTLTKGVEDIASHFSALGIIATSALATIASKATQTATQMLKAFSFGPITDGLSEYETNLNSIQTILSNTQWQGATLDQVNAALYKLNLYSDKTIYNFSEMARNIGTFTSAGVKLDTSVNAIKGIANLAAISGSSADQASTAMYQLSQAMATGTVRLMDWNSVVNAGMGGKVFQDSLKETARVHGVAVDKIIKEEGSFRDSLSKGWLTTNILTETLSKFTGELSAQQLKSMGYSKQQIVQIMKMGQTATDAATKIKTFHQLIDTLKESFGSGWSQTWQLILGDFGEAKSMWSGAYNVLNGMVQASSNARNKMLGDWKAMGGRTLLIEAITDAFHNLMDVIHAISGAFREVFPKKTGEDLYNMTYSVWSLVQNFKMGAKTLDNLKRTFAGFFAVLDIGWQIVKAGIGFIGDLFGMLTKGEGSGGFLEATANIGDFLVSLDKAIKTGKLFEHFMKGLEKMLQGPINALKWLADFQYFSWFDLLPKGDSSKAIGDALSPIESIGHAIVSVWTGIVGILDKVWTKITSMVHSLMGMASQLGDAIQSAFGGKLNYDDILHTLNTAIAGGFLLLLHHLMSMINGGMKRTGSGAGLLDRFLAPFKQLTDTLVTMQNTLRATTLMEIAIAVGLLAGSVVALSLIDPVALTKALTAISVMFGQLMIALLAFTKIGPAKGLVGTSAGLVLFAAAIDMLTIAVKVLASLSWEDLAKGLLGVTVLIGGLATAVKIMGNETAGMIKTGAGLMLLAIGIKILASAVTDLSGLSWGEMAKGLVGVGVLLGALTLFTKFAETNQGGMLQSAGLVLLASAIKILASAVNDFAGTSWEGLVKGLGSISLILAAFAIFSKTAGNPATLLSSGAALIMIAGAMKVLASAVADFGAMNWGEIAKGLVSMAVALTLIAVAINAMPPMSSLPSAAALMAVGAALIMIGTSLRIMGGMSWEEIAKGLITLAGALTIIAVAMDAMITALPGAAALLIVSAALAIFVPELALLGSLDWGTILKGLIALAAAFTLIGVAGLLLTPVIPSLLALGVAMLGMGAGLALMALGVGIIATTLSLLASGIIQLGGAFVAVSKMIPQLIGSLGAALAAILDQVVMLAPKMAKAITVVVLSILSVIRNTSPQIIRTFGQLMVNLLAELARDTPKMADSAFRMFIGILKALEKNEPVIVAEMINLIVKLLEGLAAGMPRFTKAGGDLIVGFLEGIAKQVPRVAKSAADIIIAWIKAIGEQSLRIANAAMDAVIDFANGLADAINKHTKEFRDAGIKLAEAMINGMTFGLAGGVAKVAKGAVGVAKGAVSGAKHFLGIHSPSKVFYDIGVQVVEGFVKGLESGDRKIINATWMKADKLMDAAMTVAEKHLEKTKQELYDVTHARDRDTKAIKEATVAYLKARQEMERISDATELFNKRLTVEKDAINYLNWLYGTYDKRIQEANKSLKEAMFTKDDFFAGVKDQYQTMPEISDTTTLEDYMNQLQYQADENKRFMQVLFKLKREGLNDQMYKELLSKGTAALPLAEQILAGGDDAIKQINALDKDLFKSADKLGASTALYLQLASVREAKAAVDALKRQKWLVGKATDILAKNIVKSLQRSLTENTSPKIFEEHGNLILNAWSIGVAKLGPAFEKIGEHFGVTAFDVMKKSLARISQMVQAGDIDLHPKITPILDLSAIQRDAPRLYELLTARGIVADGSYSAAVSAATGYQANTESATDAALSTAPVQQNVTFVQNNTSPKALSTAEIYRLSNNQLSRLKGALTADAA